MPKGTPFHSRTAPLCESYNWQNWAGYLSADSYEMSHEGEYAAIRSGAALIDVSPLYKYHIHGEGAQAFLNRVVTRDVEKCAVGQVVYTPWCDEHGKMVDDGMISRLEAGLYRLTAADPSFRWLEGNAFGDVHIEDVSAAIAALAIQGPTSRTILKRVCDADLDHLPYYHLISTDIAGFPATITRTGYTGDLGYEIWVDDGDGEKLWDTLVEAGDPYQLQAAGNIALDIARIEAGLLLIDVDYISARKTHFEIQKSTPLELGLGWTVGLQKGYFVGQEALRAEKQRGPAWSLAGLELEWKSVEAIFRSFGMPPQIPAEPWHNQSPVYANGQHAGKTTSATWSPALNKIIALARLKPRYARPGTKLEVELAVEGYRPKAAATVVKLPFFDPPRKRSIP